MLVFSMSFWCLLDLWLAYCEQSKVYIFQRHILSKTFLVDVGHCFTWTGYLHLKMSQLVIFDEVQCETSKILIFLPLSCQSQLIWIMYWKIASRIRFECTNFATQIQAWRKKRKGRFHFSCQNSTCNMVAEKMWLEFQWNSKSSEIG